MNDFLVELFYWVMLAFFVTHELDAMKRHEWRLIPFICRLPEVYAERLFIWSHVPIFLSIFWFSKEGPFGLFPIALSVYSIFHAGLHWVYQKHPSNEFIGFSAWGIILLTAAFAALHLWVVIDSEDSVAGHLAEVTDKRVVVGHFRHYRRSVSFTSWYEPSGVGGCHESTSSRGVAGAILPKRRKTIVVECT